MSDPTDPLDGLPERLDYIRDVVMTYTRAGRADEQKWRTFVDSLSGDRLDQIAALYRKLAARGDAQLLSTWIEERKPGVREKWNAWWDAQIEAEEKGLPIPREPEQEPRALRLFELFDYLGPV